MLVNVLELAAGRACRRGASSRSSGDLDERARELIDGVLDYARSGELVLAARSRSRTVMADVETDLRAALDAAGADLVVGELPEVRGGPAPATAGACRTSSGTR